MLFALLMGKRSKTSKNRIQYSNNFTQKKLTFTYKDIYNISEVEK